LLLKYQSVSVAAAAAGGGGGGGGGEGEHVGSTVALKEHLKKKATTVVV
jgi:hypothetical protein